MKLEVISDEVRRDEVRSMEVRSIEVRSPFRASIPYLHTNIHRIRKCNGIGAQGYAVSITTDVLVSE